MLGVVSDRKDEIANAQKMRLLLLPDCLELVKPVSVFRHQPVSFG